MSPTTIEAATAIASLLLSALVSAFIAGRVVGRYDQEIAQLKTSSDKTQDLSLDVKMLTRDVAEIKGMFRLELRRDDGGQLYPHQAVYRRRECQRKCVR